MGLRHSYDSQFRAPDNTRLAEGVARGSHLAEDDLPQGHQSFDLDFNLAVDPQYQDLVGGNPSQQTGNYAPGDEQGSVHMEWESEAIPSWAWPTKNDRLKTWGSWIWDCGHWGVGSPDFFIPSQIPYNGAITGERTEFHSVKALVVTRANPSSTPANETQTDVFASTDGRRAHAQEQCAHDHPAPTGSTTYGPDYTACVQLATMNRQTLNDRDYSFFVPAPPQPAPGATLTYRIVDRQGGLEPPEVVTPTANGINVTIKYSGSPAPAYGKTFYVGWSTETVSPDHLQVTVNSIKVNRSLDPNPTRTNQSGTPPGEYNLYLDANGDWKYINDWAPGLLTTTDGQVFPVNRGTDFYVQSGKGVRIFFTGRECDFVGINPCPQTPELSDQNDRPGDIVQAFPSVSTALGQHTAQSDKSTPSLLDPTVLPNYELTYTVGRVAGGSATVQPAATVKAPPKLTPVPTAPCKGKAATIVGTKAAETLKGTNGADVISALGGNDKVNGKGGKDMICGGAGKDKLSGGGGNDKLLGQKGKDTLKGGPGKDKLIQ